MDNIKCFEEEKNIRLVFNWKDDFEQVYIFTNNAEPRMFTLQEYKKRGGCLLPKTPGVFTYSVRPFKRENGEDVLYDGASITHTCRITVNYSVKEKIARYKNFEITLNADHPVGREIIKYKLKAGGVEYDFAELIKASAQITRVVRAKITDELNLYINEKFADLYILKG